MSSGLPPVFSSCRPPLWGLLPLLILPWLGSGPLMGGLASPDVLLSQIQELIQRGDLSAASHQLSSALKRFPREPGFHNFLGVVKAQQADFKAAELSFRRATTLDPRFAGAWLNLGRLYQESSAHDPVAVRKALDAYLELLRFQPDNLEANYQAAVLFQRLKAFGNSQRCLSRLPAEARAKAQALSLQLVNYAALGETAKAQDTTERLLSSTDLSEADIVAVQQALEVHNQTDLELRLLRGLDMRRLASPEASINSGYYSRKKKIWWRPVRSLIESRKRRRPRRRCCWIWRA